jgi:hypothetical protein
VEYIFAEKSTYILRGEGAMTSYKSHICAIRLADFALYASFLALQRKNFPFQRVFVAIHASKVS